jgi:hypothetical protein
LQVFVALAAILAMQVSQLRGETSETECEWPQ